jgi:hypothetical protein
MKMIYKYPIDVIAFGAPVNVDIPGYVRIVHFDRDGSGQVCVWAQVDDKPRYEYTVPLFVVPTGTPFNAAEKKATYHSTLNDNGFFWHLYVGTPADVRVLGFAE